MKSDVEYALLAFLESLYVALAGILPPAAPRPGAPSWVAELEDDDPDQTSSQVREVK